jgi:hypothetical protein
MASLLASSGRLSLGACRPSRAQPRVVCQASERRDGVAVSLGVALSGALLAAAAAPAPAMAGRSGARVGGSGGFKAKKMVQSNQQTQQ